MLQYEQTLRMRKGDRLESATTKSCIQVHWNWFPEILDKKNLPRWILEAPEQLAVRLTFWQTRDPKPKKKTRRCEHSAAALTSFHILMMMTGTIFTLAFLWLRLSEDSLKVMEGLWDLPGVLGEMSWWRGLRPSQLQLLSLWRTPRDSLQGEREKKNRNQVVGKDGACRSHQKTSLKSQTSRRWHASSLGGNKAWMDTWRRLKPVQRGVIQGCGGASWPLSPVSLRQTPFRIHKQLHFEKTN